MNTNTTTDKLIDVVQQMLAMIKDGGGKATPPKPNNKESPVKLVQRAITPMFQDIVRRLEIIEDTLCLKLPDPVVPPPAVKKKRTRR